MKKEIYEAPEVLVVEMEVQAVIAQSPTQGELPPMEDGDEW